mmetsp:Transcript_24283/g.37470  ORF Transcript_24283/g.37470 Transcript_24283/m.37470 type:complete len:209 (-) Transcript_24283:1586-2212(-)
MVSECESQVVSKSLERDDAQKGAQGKARSLNVENAAAGEGLEALSQGLVLDVSDDDGHEVHLTLESLHFFDHLHLIRLLVENNDYDRRLRELLKVAEEVISEVVKLDLLAVQVGQLLHLQCALLGDALGDALAHEEDMPLTGELLGDLLRFIVHIIKGLLQVATQHLQLLYHLVAELLRGVEVLVLSEPDRYEGHHRHLADERLRTGH